MAKKSTVVRQQAEEEQIENELPEESVIMDETEQAMSDEEMRMEIESKMQIFGGGLQTLFNKQVSLKAEVEERWLNDLRHYNGRYDRDTEARMAQPGTNGGRQNSSRVFVNLTRAKTNLGESKLSDMVLPTDDRNWGIKPTPVPEISKMMEDTTPVQLADGSTAVDPETQQPHTGRDMAQVIMEAARKACDAMQNEIDDQLTECQFNSVGREIIHDACVMGTGIIKGPMIERSTKRAWVKRDGVWVMDVKQGIKPTATRVDPWNFFPDMAAVKWVDCEFVFERHLLNRKQIRKLAKQPGFMAEQVSRVLESASNASSANLNYLNELREISGITQIQNDSRYEVLEYHGPVSKSDLIVCGCDGVDENNPLEEYEGTVWLCNGIVIKVALHHMDSETLPYNVLCWEEDDTCVFGFGIPYRMRAPQRVMNASWRMVLDNAGLSTGPQLLINRGLVEPADGKWELSPRKIWWMNTKDPHFRADYAMQAFNIQSNQADLTAIFNIAHQLADEETSLPQMQMGGQSAEMNQPAMLKTLGGTALWMSSNNIMMRRAVKNWDDRIIVPFITRFYDWNMQFNEKDDIKGDFSIDARGTSVLLVREMQARNMEGFINAAMTLPDGAKELKPRGMLKSMAKSMQVPIDEIMRTDDEAKAADEAEKNNPPVDPEAQKLQMQMQMKQMEIQDAKEALQMEAQLKMTTLEGERQIALINREVELSKIAANQQVSIKKIQTDAGIKKYDIDWKIKAFYEEALIKQREGETANYGLEK
jgi:hypothetical protein